MRKLFGIVALVGLMVLAACSGATEPDALDSAAEPVAEEALQPVDEGASAETEPESTTESSRPDQLGAPDEPSSEEKDVDENVPDTAIKPETTAVSPVVVDLSEVTPSVADENVTPQVMPAPGRPGEARIPEALQPLITSVSETLAGERAVAADTIAVTGVEQVTWPDGSLGCPEKGMMYTQALVDGYLITMNVDGQPVEVHTAGNSRYVVCDNGEPVASGSVAAPGVDPSDT